MNCQFLTLPAFFIYLRISLLPDVDLQLLGVLVRQLYAK